MPWNHNRSKFTPLTTETSSTSRLRLVGAIRQVAEHRALNDPGDFVVTFGQPSGPPASAQQMRRLLELVHQAGHTDFRDARGPLQLTQRQAAGRFTRSEAENLIAQLEGEADEPDGPSLPTMSAAQQRLQSVPDAVLAAELQRRGWIVVEP